MEPTLKKISKNVIERTFFTNKVKNTHLFLMLSDLHWDNPKCNRELLKKHLDEAIAKGAKIIINGDFFCLMQGKGDPRKNKSDILPEHNNARYLDSIVQTAVDWWEPYWEHIDFIGYGNHETSIIKHQETDILQRFVDLLNFKTKLNVQVGGYGGWYIISQARTGANSKVSVKMKYYHGTGGGGPVTKGAIQNNRMQVAIHGADIYWQGHVHEDYEMSYPVETLDKKNNIIHKDIIHVRTSTYKEEYGVGAEGWHVERGGHPKLIGGRWLEVDFHRNQEKTEKSFITFRTR